MDAFIRKTLEEADIAEREYAHWQVERGRRQQETDAWMPEVEQRSVRAWLTRSADCGEQILPPSRPEEKYFTPNQAEILRIVISDLRCELREKQENAAAKLLVRVDALEERISQLEDWRDEMERQKIAPLIPLRGGKHAA